MLKNNLKTYHHPRFILINHEFCFDLELQFVGQDQYKWSEKVPFLLGVICFVLGGWEVWVWVLCGVLT